MKNSTSNPFSLAARTVLFLVATAIILPAGTGLIPTHLRCEYLANPLGLDETEPRLSWQLAATERGQRQTACRLLVASSAAQLAADTGDLWDTGKIAGDQTVNVAYAGKPLTARLVCHWKVQVWDKDDQPSPWSQAAQWSVGLLQPGDWQAQWISFTDNAPLPTDRQRLHLPPARHYRKGFNARKSVRRATIYASALGIFELHLNGQRVGDEYFAPGWSDYRQRAYSRAYDVTSLVRPGANAVGAIVADGWYAGYVGYGLLVGYGPNKAGRCFYGKTPALLVQLEIEYDDGDLSILGTDPTWKVTDQGPLREADLIMGETYDARREMPGWSAPGFDDRPWDSAIRAEANGSTKAVFSDQAGNREVELGFQPPRRLQNYAAQPIRVTQELKPVRLLEPQPGVYIFDLGQNFAGLVRLKVNGPAGTRVQLRFGEMLHPDGRLMTENLRKARATDAYILRGDPAGETWTPRFTYHGFQYVELTGVPEQPSLDALTGLVLHNDTPRTSAFECSDPVVNRLFQNIVWTQRANFIEIPTDCPQRDERMGWMGDAQIYVRTATYNADVAAFFTKWMDDVEEAQLSFGAYPDYCPYPMTHGQPHKGFGTAWTDAGIICPWTLWQVYGDTRILDRHYDSFRRFLQFRLAVSPDYQGLALGNPWGDWLCLGEPTPIEYVDAVYFAYATKLMAGIAAATGRTLDAQMYRQVFDHIRQAFNRQYVRPDGQLKVETQTAYVLALFAGLIPDKLSAQSAAHLVQLIAQNDYRMTTGFLGTKSLLPVLTATGHHDLAVRLFQSRQFPSWCYEVEQGATSIWERWDSYTKEHGFEGQSGRQNAAMNSFSHYSFGAVCEWMFRDLAGIDTDGPGFKHIVLRPGPPTPGSNPDQKPIAWVNAEYHSIHGRIVSHWQRHADRFELQATLPPNTTATVLLPATSVENVRVDGHALEAAAGVKFLRMEGQRAVLRVPSGTYHFLGMLEK